MSFDLGNILEPTEPPKDEPQSKKEASRFEKDRLKKKLKRDDAQKGTLHYIFLCGAWIAFLIAVVIVTVRVAHFVLPDCQRWLTTEDISNIDKTLSSGFLGALIGSYLNKTTIQG